MMRLLPFFLLFACAGTGGLLGGQEGEPVAPPPAAEPIDDFADPETCTVVASCSTEAWCADYSTVSAAAELQESCEALGGVFDDAPCEMEQNTGFCRDEANDPCTVVWLFGGDGAACDDFDLAYVAPRG